jgi:hypothetical protein
MTHPDPRVNDLLGLFPPPRPYEEGHFALGENWGEPIERAQPWWRRVLHIMKGTLR